VFTDDKRFFIVGGYKTFTVYKRDVRDQLYQFSPHQGNITCMIYLSPGNLFTGSEDKKILAFKLNLCETIALISLTF
jgi:WD40 repeat protein